MDSLKLEMLKGSALPRPAAEKEIIYHVANLARFISIMGKGYGLALHSLHQEAGYAQLIEALHGNIELVVQRGWGDWVCLYRVLNVKETERELHVTVEYTTCAS